MNEWITTFAATVGAVMGLMSIGSVLYLAGGRLARLEVKVDTMWAFQMRRAISEVVNNELGTLRSPLELSAHAQTYLDPIRVELREFWQAQGRFLSDADALLELERLFGERLIKDVCVPCKLSHGACLLLALSVAKDATKLELKL